MSDEASTDIVRPPHPRFAAHFRRPVYDPNHPDFRDEVPPFGSDEGADAVFEWSDRADELVAHPTLRYVIEDEESESDADAFVAELEDTEQIDVDDILIGLGFALLRYTGQIDQEGRAWLEQAIIRQRDREGGVDGDYDLILTDLRSFA